MMSRLDYANFYYTLGDEEVPWFEKFSDPQHCFVLIKEAREALKSLKEQDNYDNLTTVWAVRTNSKRNKVKNNS